jgi:NADH-quinone oxidoreductase chain G
MIKLFINNQPVSVVQNSTILEACESLGITIPRFCYHMNLNVAGNCRMCLVEIEKQPKPIAACAYPAINNVKVFTNTPLVEKARENILELLLLNHPLDCPICDQAGECDLQEQTLNFSIDKSRFTFEKRSVEDLNCSPLIKLLMTRCIHCTRCIRFLKQVSSEEELGVLGRGTNSEINFFYQNNILNEFSGNIIDLCPVGALTSKVYTFSTRPWELQSTLTIDITDGLGTPITIFSKNTEIVKITSSTLNENFISNKIKFSIDGYKNNLLLQSWVFQNKYIAVSWYYVFLSFKKIFQILKSKTKLNSTIIIGTYLSLEAIEFLKKLAYTFNIGISTENMSIQKTSNFFLLQSTNSSNLLNSVDTLLLLSVNPRLENNLFNLKIKNKSSNFFLSIASIGMFDDFLYKKTSLGTTYSTFIQIMEGKHVFSLLLAKTIAPLILVGPTIAKRIDNQVIFKNTAILNKVLKKSSNAPLINFFPSFNISIGSDSLIGLQHIDLLKLKTVLSFELNSFSFFKKFLNLKQMILQTSVNIEKIMLPYGVIKLYIPSSSFLETEENYMFFSGIIKKTQTVLKTFRLSILQLIKIIYFMYGFSMDLEKTKFYGINSPKYTIQLCQTSNIYSLLKKKVFKTFFKCTTTTSYQNTLYTKNSTVLSLCSQNERKDYTSFMSLK